MEIRTTRDVEIGDTVFVAGNLPGERSPSRYLVLKEVLLPSSPKMGRMFEIVTLDGPNTGNHRNCWDYYLVLAPSNPPGLSTQPLPNL